MSLFEIMFYLHSFNRYLLLSFLSLVIINSLIKFIGRKKFSRIDNSFSFILMILAHVQLLIGIYLYIESPLVIFGANTMKVPTLRYWTAEHIAMMLPAIVLITVGRMVSKRKQRKVNVDSESPHAPHLTLLVTNGLALVMISISLFSMLRISI